MLEKISKYRIYIVVALFLVLTVATALVGRNRTTVKLPSLEKQKSPYITESAPFAGTFVANYENLYSISVEPNEEYETFGRIEVSLLDENGNVLGVDTKDCQKIDFGYMTEFNIKAKLNVGSNYLVLVKTYDCGEDGVSVSVINGTALLTELTYKAPITAKGMLPYVLIYAILALLIIAAVEDRKSYSQTAKLVSWGFFIIAGASIILMNDEATRPLSYMGTELNHDMGFEDYRGFLTASAESGDTGGILCSTNEYMLNKGEYTVGLSYLSSSDANTVAVMDDGVLLYEFNVNNFATYDEYTFSVDKDTQNTVIAVKFSGDGVFKVNQLNFQRAGGKAFYSDNYFFLVLFIVLNLTGFVLYQCRERIDKKTLMTVIMLVGISLLGLFPYLNSKLWPADDLAYHLYRIEGIKDAIIDGQFPAVIYPNALSGNGYLNSMYPYLFLYIPAILRIFRVSLVLSYKVLVFLANLATASLTYVAIKSMLDEKVPHPGSYAILGSLLYIMLPYRFNNIYARGAVGEILAMTFLPFLFASIYHLLLGNRDKWYWIIIALSGLLQSHIISFVLGCVITAICCAVFVRELFKESRWLKLIEAAGISVLVNLWFLVPFVSFYMGQDIRTEALDWHSFSEYVCDPGLMLNMIGAQDYRYLSLGIPVAFLAFFGIIHVVYEDKSGNGAKENYLRLLFSIGGALTLLITTYGASFNLKSVYVADKLLSTMQFAWRLFAQSTALFIFVGVIWLSESQILEKYNLKRVLVVMLATVSLFVGMRGLDSFEAYSNRDYTDTYSEGHEIKVGGVVIKEGIVSYPYEYRVNGVDETVIFNSYYLNDYEGTEVLSYNKKGTSVDITYTANSSGAAIVLPIMFYDGYEAFDESGNKLNLAMVHKYAIEAPMVGDGILHELHIQYNVPIIFKVATMISILSLVGIGVYCCILKRMPQK